jgi:hypothetical protein
VKLITDDKTNNLTNQWLKPLTECARGIGTVPEIEREGATNMKFNLLQKQTSRREMLRGSALLAGSAFLAHLFPTTSMRASILSYRQQTPSPVDLLATMRAKFNAAPLKTQRLGEDVTMFSGPGGTSTTPTTTRLFTPPEPPSSRTKIRKSGCQSRTICRSLVRQTGKEPNGRSSRCQPLSLCLAS